MATMSAETPNEISRDVSPEIPRQPQETLPDEASRELRMAMERLEKENVLLKERYANN